MNSKAAKTRKIIYLGFNHMLKHKRGVENVIEFQAQAIPNNISYYIHWDDETSVYTYKNFICIGIKSDFKKYLIFNLLILRLKRKEKNIFIHSHNTLMTMVCIFKTNLFTVHDALYYQTKALNHKFKYLFYVLEKFLYQRVDFVHFISQFSKKMSLYSNRGKHQIIYNTSFLEGFKPSNGLSESLQFNPDKTKIFVVRSMEERARIDLIIDLAQHLKNKSFQIFVAGKGPLLEQYKARIKERNLNNIKILGFVKDEDLVNYYKTCDFVLMPAEYAEGFGLPIIEAYLFNKPVIASNRCAIPEVICSNQYLFENTVDSIISKLDVYKLEPRIAFKEYYDKIFSNRIILDQFSTLYKSLMK
jgi:glycosyltransferase involved in cell wall biosynthesis